MDPVPYDEELKAWISRFRSRCDAEGLTVSQRLGRLLYEIIPLDLHILVMQKARKNCWNSTVALMMHWAEAGSFRVLMPFLDEGHAAPSSTGKQREPDAGDGRQGSMLIMDVTGGGFRPYLRLQGAGAEWEALADTGAAISLVSEELLRRGVFDKPRAPNLMTAKAVNGSGVRITGKVAITLQFGAEAIPWKF